MNGRRKLYGAMMQVAREKAGITQADLAAAIGRSKSWVVDIERGKSTPPIELVVPLQQAVNAPARVVTEWALAQLPPWSHEMLASDWHSWFMEMAEEAAKKVAP